VTAPLPGEEGGARFAFAAGPRASAGYVQIPVPGDQLRAEGASAVELLVRADADAALDVVLVAADCAWRAPLAAGSSRWTRRRIGFEEFHADRSDAETPIVPRFLRLEAAEAGIAHPVTVELRDVSFPAAERPAPRATAAAEPPAAAREGRRALGRVVVEGGTLRADSEAYFPFGLFLLGGNRSLLEQLAEAGGNAVVEYGTVSWPLVTVEDHLDYARCAGVRVGAALTFERDGVVRASDARLAPLGAHPALLAWYLFDEPDGARNRGIPPEVSSPAALRARRERLATAPALVVCVHSFGLAHYADTAELLATDTYWPAQGRDRSMAGVHSDAEAIVEIAERAGAAPLQVLQLADPTWRHAMQEPATLRAQVLGSLAAGVRGILLFQGAAAARLADEGDPDGRLWGAFLDLASDVATWAPLAARWTRLRDGIRVQPPLGEVRASCFAAGDETWIVLVNLGRDPADFSLRGDCLAGAIRLEDPSDGWRAEIVGGAWSGRLAAWEGRVVKIVTEDEVGERPVVVTSRAPWAPDSREVVRYDRAVLGATLLPAPVGPIALSLDGRELDGVLVHRGPAAVVRRTVRELAPGDHAVELRWREGGREREDRWTFEVRSVPVEWVDRFDRTDLGDLWGVVRDVPWNAFDPADGVAEGDVRIEGRELRVASTGGSIGAVLRRVEAPSEFTLRFRARAGRGGGAILVQRNDVFLRVELADGAHEVALHERNGRQSVDVDGARVREWARPIYHRGGPIGLGVPAGGEAWFDDVSMHARQATAAERGER
jgi:hypothetical protein